MRQRPLFAGSVYPNVQDPIVVPSRTAMAVMSPAEHTRGDHGRIRPTIAKAVGYFTCPLTDKEIHAS
jgi:hypothetical protein